MILNLAFTGSLARHRREVREHWGGPLCLVRREHSRAELDAIRDDVVTQVGEGVLSSYLDESEGIVGVEAIVVDDETKAWVDERYGSGLVRFEEGLDLVE